jgi:hypothetical protein
VYWRVRLDDFSASLAGANTLTIVRLTIDRVVTLEERLYEGFLR